VASEELLATIETYYDAAPRSAAVAEDCWPFTLFVQTETWPYYARPALGAKDFAADHVRRVRARQRELGVPETFEWVAETTPALRPAAELAGLAVADHPLLVLEGVERQTPAPADVELRLVGPDDDLAVLGAVARLGFASPGTAIGAAGPADLAPLAAERTAAEIAFEREQIRFRDGQWLGSGQDASAKAPAAASGSSIGTKYASG
jgi:hypothetical protein